LKLEKLYKELDFNDRYENQWGYGNPAAAAYWGMRDELVFDAMRKNFSVLSADLKILELGTGHGHELSKFAHLGVPSRNLFGVDIVFGRIAWAKNVYSGLNFVQQDGLNLAFPSDTFDVVVEINCLAHAESIDAQIAISNEMLRVLKPNGIIVWFDIAPVSLMTSLLSQLLTAIASSQPKKLILVIKTIIWCIFNSELRRLLVKKYGAPYLLPISVNTIFDLFKNHTVNAKYAGLDYKIWSYLWGRFPLLSRYLWGVGWFPRHSFAVIKKITIG
jgi:SAM-dependent methyltransferase